LKTWTSLKQALNDQRKNHLMELKVELHLKKLLQLVKGDKRDNQEFV